VHGSRPSRGPSPAAPVSQARMARYPGPAAGGVRGFRGGFSSHARGDAHVGPQRVPPRSDDHSGPVRRLRGDFPQVTGAGSVGEALPDPAAAAGERGRSGTRHGEDGAGGVTAVIQGPPTRTRGGRSASVTTQVTSYSKPSGKPVVPGETWRRAAAGRAPRARPPGLHSGLHPVIRVTSATRSHTSFRPGGDHLLGRPPSAPVTLVGDRAAVSTPGTRSSLPPGCLPSICRR